MKELQEYAPNKALDQYHLNLHVLDFNYNSTYTEHVNSSDTDPMIYRQRILEVLSFLSHSFTY